MSPVVMYTRASASDYDAWEIFGNHGWGSKDLIPLANKVRGLQSFYPNFEARPIPRWKLINAVPTLLMVQMVLSQSQLKMSSEPLGNNILMWQRNTIRTVISQMILTISGPAINIVYVPELCFISV